MAESIAGPSRSRSESPGPSRTIMPEGFTVLYSGQGDILADVIFIHGLGGDPERTWSKTLSSQPNHSRGIKTLLGRMTKGRKVKEQKNVQVERSVFWPRDLLPLKVGNIRILTYGYDSKFVNGRNKNGIYQHAENMLSALERARSDLAKDSTRKIIFVAHSLGGVIVKEVLRQSSNHTHQAHLLTIFHDTYGIIFLACPHRGSSATEWGVIAANIAKLCGLPSNTNLLRSLGTDSQMLSSLSLDFSRYLKDGCFKVHSFREEQGMTGVVGISGKIVEDASSIIGDADEGKEGINANHREMGRFGSLEDEGFLKIAGVISRYVQDLRNIRTSADRVGRQELRHECRRNIADLSDNEKKCLQSLAHADYSTYRGRIPARLPGTLEWVPEHEVYQRWDSKDTSSMLLWISGNPGHGKTVMSVFLLDRLEIKVQGTDASVAYFFCDDKEGLQKSAQSLLRAIIHQLITKTPNLIKHAMGAHTAHGSKMLESLDLLWKVFISAATDPICDGTYIVLDGLDECEKDSRNDFIRRLNNYFQPEVNKASHPFLKVLITSRPYREIQLMLSKHRTIRLKTEDEGPNIQADITRFISQKLDEMEEICYYDSELKEKIRTKLQAGADGMFLWVALVVQELLDTPIDFMSEALETTPTDLYDLYTHLLKRLDGRKAIIARKILTWVVMAPMPMTVIELAIACSVKCTDESESSMNRSLITGFEHNISLCGPILKVEQGVVYLIHQSAKEFLLNPCLRDSLGDLGVIPERASLELAITCLTYLSFDDFEPTSSIYNFKPKSSFAEVEGGPLLADGRAHDFYRHAAHWWPQFVHRSSEQDPNILKAFYRLTEFNSRLSLAFQLGMSDDRDMAGEEHIEPLYVSSHHGLCSISLTLLDGGANVNAQNGWLGTALHAATNICHKELVLLLLNRGAEVDTPGVDWGTALQIAVEGGDREIVLLLLEHGADVNTKKDKRSTPLQMAAEVGNQEMVLLLLGHGADVNNKRNGYDKTALLRAVYSGHEEIILLLLEHGADVNAQGGEYGNALQAAAERGDETVVLLLLKHGADVNAPGGVYGNALAAAATLSKERVVRLLLEHGADVNAQGGEYGNALQAAANRGHETVVLLLLERGADVNAQGGYYDNALQAAVIRGHEKVVLQLLEHGADINAQGGLFNNALHAAIDSGVEKIVLLLLEHGADANAQGGYYGNALNAAINSRVEKVVLLLLKHGANVNAQGGDYGNALQAAVAGRGNENLVLLLLEHGANANAQGGEYGNALQAAAERGDETVVLLLLKHGADVNAPGGVYGNALAAAAILGKERVVCLLLEHGADVNAQGGKYGNALQAAANRGYETVVLLLLERGADVNAQGGHYGNALKAAAASIFVNERVEHLLLEHGADINASGECFANASQVARPFGDPAVVDLLIGNSPMDCSSP